MKITKKKITAASAMVTIPAPFDQFYKPMTDEEFEQYTGYPAHPSPCEESDGYDIQFITYVIAKDKYLDALANEGIDCVELIESGWGNGPHLAYTVHDRIFPVDEDDLEAAGVLD